MPAIITQTTRIDLGVDEVKAAIADYILKTYKVEVVKSEIKFLLEDGGDDGYGGYSPAGLRGVEVSKTINVKK